MDNIESTNVPLTMCDDTCTTHVTSTSDHDDVACIELDKVDNLVLLKVKLDGIVDLDGRVGVADSSAVVGDDVGNTLGTNGNLSDFEELVGRLLGGDAVDDESALDVVQETEVLSGLFDGDHVCGLFSKCVRKEFCGGETDP
jgi:hypothetical protein